MWERLETAHLGADLPQLDIQYSPRSRPANAVPPGDEMPPEGFWLSYRSSPQTRQLIAVASGEPPRSEPPPATHRAEAPTMDVP
jgi:hypothetical protein